MRYDVLDAFDDDGCFYHTTEQNPEGFIDGMAWIGVLCGASLLAGDEVLTYRCTEYLRTLIQVGQNARNFSTRQIDGWKPAGWLWYKEKPQNFAGPAGLWFANMCGAGLKTDWVPNPTTTARLLCAVAWPFGLLVKPVSALRQHINSVMMAHMILRKTPPSNLDFLCEGNPLYSFIAGKPCAVWYVNRELWSDYEEVKSDRVHPLDLRKPSVWPFKSWPYTAYMPRYLPGGDRSVKYTPIASLISAYLNHAYEKGIRWNS